MVKYVSPSLVWQMQTFHLGRQRHCESALPWKKKDNAGNESARAQNVTQCTIADWLIVSSFKPWSLPRTSKKPCDISQITLRIV